MNALVAAQHFDDVQGRNINRAEEELEWSSDRLVDRSAA